MVLLRAPGFWGLASGALEEDPGSWIVWLQALHPGTSSCSSTVLWFVLLLKQLEKHLIWVVNSERVEMAPLLPHYALLELTMVLCKQQVLKKTNRQMKQKQTKWFEWVSVMMQHFEVKINWFNTCFAWTCVPLSIIHCRLNPQYPNNHSAIWELKW